ncbi:MAG: carbohydrate ABC transporter permease [Clostridia bacterium]|nr:carbohydrate ABC transporter permease [Clostridia bacterium]
MKKRLVPALFGTLALLLSLSVVFPLIAGVLGAFKNADEFLAPHLFPKHPTLDNFVQVDRLIPLGSMFLNSLTVATLGASVRMLLALLAAYAFAFYDFKGKKVLFFLLLGPMMLPADILTVTNYQTVSSLELTDTYLGMAITSFVGATQMFMLRQQFMHTPKALRESALLDGCGDFRFILSILLPLCRPVLITLFVQAFINVWNMYLWPLMVTNEPSMRTIQVGITKLTAHDATAFHLVLAGAALSLIPAFILFFCLRKAINRSLEEGALIG